MYRFSSSSTVEFKTPDETPGAEFKIASHYG